MRGDKTIDKFGRGRRSPRLRGPPGIGFKHTSDGDFDMEGNVLTNVAEPKNNSDAVTKRYVQNELHRLRVTIADIINKDVLDWFTKNNRSLEEKMNTLKAEIYKEVYNKLPIFDMRIIALEKHVAKLTEMIKK